MSISEKVLDAIQILADNSVKRADYDRTIQAKILSCEDATIGKYRCRYQDAVFYAYSNNTDITYSDNALVYVLVPGNDFNKEKTILGTTKKLGINYITQAEGDQAYDIIGTNGIESSQTFYLDTNYEYEYSIYEAEGEKSIELDTQAIEKYIKESSSIIVGAAIKTSIKAERQLRGHYGIVYNLKFIDNATGKETIRSYTIDEDNMVGNPYRLLYPIRQYQIFDIDGPNFVRVESIKIFCKSFPNSVPLENNTELHPDIEISQLQLNGACRMSESQINGIAISFYTPQGTFFPPGTKGGNKLITAQVRVKGKLVSTDQKIPFYWGKENVGVTPSNPYYNKYLGRGWKCINSKQELDSETFEWIPGKNTYVMNFGEATAKDNWLKVAIVYDGNVISKKINIQNLTDKTYPIIESNDGTKFYYDVGHPTLTVKIMQKKDGVVSQIKDISQFQYYWAYEDNTGNLIELPQIFGTKDNPSPNDEYNQAVSDLNELTNDIQKNANAENIRTLNETIKKYDFIQRVEKNQIHDVQIRNITSFGTFKCSVFSGELYIGTAQITLTNTLDGEGLYSLVINNGSAVYQYNENGVAPNNKTLDNPQQIPALTFTVYDNQGKPLDSNMIVNDSKCKVRWKVPLGNDTLLVDNMPVIENDPNRIKTESYVYYDKAETLSYGIANKYDIKKQNNQIQLTVDYKGLNLIARTNFTFAKQGEPGTNGTEYIVKIIPNTTMNNPPLWPMITKNIKDQDYWLNYGVGSSASSTKIGINVEIGGNPFKAQLWQNGELIWQGFKVENNYEGIQPDLVHWEVLKNVYKQGLEDYSALKITSQGKVTYLGEKPSGTLETDILKITGANIIKCSITYGGRGKTYYGTLPVTTAQVLNKNYYRIGLRNFTGFRHVLYTSDGINPQYDNSHPFEFYCEELIKKEGTEIQTWEDISNVEGNHKIIYDFSAIGKYQSYDETYTSTNANLLTILGEAYRKGLTPNQCPARPAARYDGQCVNVAICCKMSHQNGQIIGKIKVPIHYLLNKFGLSHINDWDGNSIQINNDGGYILSPQMGAGVKNKQNQFTGVLMGEVITPNKKESDIGLLGYANGDRTFFLNSKNGSAIFGKTNKGQITIDPVADRGVIYSGNFWKADNYNQNGLPKKYNYRNFPDEEERNKEGFNQNDEKYFEPDEKYINKEGLIIDLTTPEIYFGTGNFYVTKDGYIHAKGGGNIAGWQIKDTALQSKSGGITLDSSGKVYSGTHSSLTKTSDGFYLAADGLSIGHQVKIEKDGIMYLGKNAVSQAYDNYWTIDGSDAGSYISFGKLVKLPKMNGNKVERDEKQNIIYENYNQWFPATPWGGKNPDNERLLDSGADASKGQVNDPRGKTIYLGTDGISLGKRFSVSPSGELIAYSGTIGGWTIDSSKIYAESIQLNSDGSMKGGYAKAILNKDKPDETTNTQWSISNQGVASFNYIQANSGGKIGGWTIEPGTLTGTSNGGNKIILDANGGTIKAVNSNGAALWSIGRGGTASFNHNFYLSGTGKIQDGGSLSGGGIGMGSGAYIKPATVVTSPGGSQTLGGYIKTLITDNLTVNHSFRYKNDWVSWNHISYVSGIQYKNNTLYWTTNQRYILSTDGSSSWDNNTGVIAPSSEPHS